MKVLLLVGLLVVLPMMPVLGQPVGEAHRVVSDETAKLRDAGHRNQLRVTVWYPAAADAVEHSVVIGPPGEPMFDIGMVAPNAGFAEGDAKRAVILLSHGFGGSGEIMGWFGIAMARVGYVVIAVDHPGNNGIDPMTIAGAVLWWDRAADLQAALRAMQRDPIIGPHLDTARIGLAGFSAGGFTVLVAAGARVDPPRFLAFCKANPADGMCRPQQEFSFSMEEAAKVEARPEIAADMAHAGEDHSIQGVRSVFAMAPALVQALDPGSLRQMHVPVLIMLGNADTVAPPLTNGLVAARQIPGSELRQLAGVGHYDFLADCTEAGRKAVVRCRTAVPQTDTHRTAIAAATAFFARTLDRGH